jgi:hypothetical protein
VEPDFGNGTVAARDIESVTTLHTAIVAGDLLARS